MSADEWFPEVGEHVVRVRNDRHSKSVIADTVDRIGKRDIVLASGERFRVRDLKQQNGSDYSTWYASLMHPGDPFVTKLREEILHGKAVSAARNACYDYIDRKADVTPYDVILALAPLTGLKDVVAEWDRVARK